MAAIDALTLIGSYSYYNSTSPSNVDALKLHVVCRNPVLSLTGYCIRHFLIVKQNFFGNRTSSMTLEQFKTESAQKKGSVKIKDSQNSESEEENGFEVYVLWELTGGTVHLPIALYDDAETKREMISVNQVILEVRSTPSFLGKQAKNKEEN